MLELFTRKVCIFPKKKAAFLRIPLFLHVCKQTFRKYKVSIFQKGKGVIMRIYCKIFISALVYF